MVYLLINENKGARLLPYKEQYRVFAEPHKAVMAAIALGWSDQLGLGFRINLLEPGVMNSHRCGEINLSLMAIETEDTF